MQTGFQTIVGKSIAARGLFYRSAWALACLAGAVGLPACRNEPPPPVYPENLGDKARPLPLLPVSQHYLPEKLATGRAEIKPLDFDRPAESAEPESAAPEGKGPGAAGAPSGESSSAAGGAEAPLVMPPLPQPTTTEFPEVTQAVHDLITRYNSTVAEGDLTALGEFYVEDKRVDMLSALKMGDKVVSRLSALLDALEKSQPGSSAMLKAFIPGGGRREALFFMQVVSLTPQSATRAVGKLGLMAGGEEIQFRKHEEAWYIDPNVEKILADARQGEALFSALDPVIEGLNNGTMDAATAQQAIVQKMQEMMKQMGGGAAPAPGDAEPQPSEPKEGGQP